MRYIISTTQEFGVSYAVDDVASPDEAWDVLIAGGGEPVGEQHPGSITGHRDQATILTPEQEAKLQGLCERYGVTYDAGDYLPAFDLPPGYVAGWVGGIEEAGHTLYVGVSPEGDASS